MSSNGDSRHAAEDEIRRLPPSEAGPLIKPGPVTAGQVFRWSAAGTAGALCVLVTVLAVYQVRSLLALFVFAVFIALSLDPMVRWLVRHRIRRGPAVAIILVVALGLFVVLVLAFVPPLVREGNQLLGDLPGFIQRLPEQSPTFRWIDERFNLVERSDELTSRLPSLLAGNAMGVARQFLGALASTVTVIVLTIYLMADLPRLRRGLVRLAPRPRRRRVAEIVNVLVDKVGAYMVGNLIISLIAGITAFAALFALGVPFALPLAVAVAVADLIPMVGATLGAAICVAVAFFTKDLWPTTILTLVFFVVYQQIENYLIAPRVMKNTVNVSALTVLMAALVGGAVLGVIGVIMAIPVAAALKVVVTPMLTELDEAGPPAKAVKPADGPGAATLSE